MYFRIIGQVGFLSDDFGIIHFASNTPIWKPLELHHYSLAINLLFKGVAQGILNAGIIHAVALVMHKIGRAHV